MFIAAAPLAVTADQKRELELLLRNGNSPQNVALRCKILLLANQGAANSTIADELKVSRPTVVALRAASANEGLKAVTGIRRRKRSPKVLTSELEQCILDTTLKTRPGDGSTHWSVRTLATHLRNQGLSSTASGNAMMCSPTVSNASNCPTIRSLRRRCATLSASI